MPFARSIVSAGANVQPGPLVTTIDYVGGYTLLFLWLLRHSQQDGLRSVLLHDPSHVSSMTAIRTVSVYRRGTVFHRPASVRLSVRVHLSPVHDATDCSFVQCPEGKPDYLCEEKFDEKLMTVAHTYFPWFVRYHESGLQSQIKKAGAPGFLLLVIERRALDMRTFAVINPVCKKSSHVRKR